MSLHSSPLVPSLCCFEQMLTAGHDDMQASYTVGGLSVSAADIECTILKMNPATYRPQIVCIITPFTYIAPCNGNFRDAIVASFIENLVAFSKDEIKFYHASLPFLWRVFFFSLLYWRFILDSILCHIIIFRLQLLHLKNPTLLTSRKSIQLIMLSVFYILL